MLAFFRKRKTYISDNENAAQEGFVNSSVSACIRFQQRWANCMQQFTERLSRNGKLIALSLFCVTAGSLSVYLIVSGMISRKPSSFTVIHIRRTPNSVKAGDENIKASVIVSKAEYEKIQRFRFYMDSLARSPSGKEIYGSILCQRPGLIDSILLVEKFFETQNK